MAKIRDIKAYILGEGCFFFFFFLGCILTCSSCLFENINICTEVQLQVQSKSVEAPGVKFIFDASQPMIMHWNI